MISRPRRPLAATGIAISSGGPVRVCTIGESLRVVPRAEADYRRCMNIMTYTADATLSHRHGYQPLEGSDTITAHTSICTPPLALHPDRPPSRVPSQFPDCTNDIPSVLLTTLFSRSFPPLLMSVA